jgi:hypothetical protein
MQDTTREDKTKHEATKKDHGEDYGEDYGLAPQRGGVGCMRTLTVISLIGIMR